MINVQEPKYAAEVQFFGAFLLKEEVCHRKQCVFISHQDSARYLAFS